MFVPGDAVRSSDDKGRETALTSCTVVVFELKFVWRDESCRWNEYGAAWGAVSRAGRLDKGWGVKGLAQSRHRFSRIICIAFSI